MPPSRQEIMRAIFLVHGGLYEGMTARKFWRDGVAGELSRLGFRVSAPDRMRNPRSWDEEASHLAPEVEKLGSAHVLAASNGCSVAARLAILSPDRVRSLLLCWPATTGDPQVDDQVRGHLLAEGCTQAIVDRLLAGEILRGLKESELARLAIPVGVMPANPPDLYHQRVNVDRLLATIPNAKELQPFPHPFAPEFKETLPEFCKAIVEFLD
jgi:pimeloyl-ACP methyl ester carboxylesterase